jgi:chromosomal replication initiator protein
VQDVTKANISDGSEKASHGCGGGMADRVAEAFRSRIGEERYAVWFGDPAAFEVSEDRLRVTVRVGVGFTQDWLRKTFHAEIVSAVRQVYGPAAEVEWAPKLELDDGEQPEAQSGDTGKPSAVPPVSAPQAVSQPKSQAAWKPGRQRTAPASVPARDTASESFARPVAGGFPGKPLPGPRHAPRLDTFVVGPSNRMAFAAVQLAASRPGEMSPLILHGPSGVGKSHLLEGICGHFRDLHPKANAVFLSAEQFTTGFLQSLHGSGLPGFRRTCRSADLLVVDDLQFFVGKRATMMELQHTIDTLHRLGRQMVFACDRELESLTELDADLLTRLRGGMTARMLPPDEDVRRGIVEAIATRRGIAISKDVVDFVAAQMTRHTRELTGAVNRLEATSHMLGVPISMGMAEEALADLVRSSGRSVRLADIERAVCSAFGIESGSLQGTQRTKRVNHPRMLAMFLARKHTSSALTEIGSYFGRRSHSTVISAQKTVVEWVSSQSQIVLADATWDVEEAIRRVEEMLRAG